MRKEVQKDMVVRLHKLQGQLEGIEKMLASGRTCTEVLTQISASRSAMEKLANLMIAEHLEMCLGETDGGTCSPNLNRDERISEVRRTLDRFVVGAG